MRSNRSLPEQARALRLAHVWQLLFLCVSLPGAGIVERSVQDERPAESFEELLVEYREQVRLWRLERRKVRTHEGRDALRETHPGVLMLPRFQAKVDAGDGRALLWMAETVQQRVRKKQDVTRAKSGLYARLCREHIGAPWFLDVVEAVFKDEGALGLARVEELALDIARRSEQPEHAATALLRLAQEYILLRGAEARVRGEALYAEVVAQHPQTEQAQSAREALHVLRFLSIGAVVQDFEATTFDGQTFKLSDYRGRVVLLDFWGFWCPPCRKDLPKLVKLLERYGDRGLSIVGVNSDSDRDDYRDQRAKAGLTWRDALDGSPGGPIARSWRISKFPSKFLIDREGRLRYRDLAGDELVQRLEELLAEPR